MYQHDTTDPAGRQAVSPKKLRDVLDIVKEKRVASVTAAGYMHALCVDHVMINPDAWMRTLHCGDVISMLETEDRQTRKLKSSYFCGQRLCPGCAYRGSLVNAVTISAITGAMVDEGYTALLVTVTAPNCSGVQLSDEIKRYNRAWNDLMKNDPYKTSWKHHIRKFEVTYNQQANTYHPHIHALVYVKAGYFGGHNKQYISQDRLLKDWRRVFKDQNITQVDIRKTHGQDWQAISELSKYIAKSSDYLTDYDTFRTYYVSLRGKRITGYAGRCKELRAEFKTGGLRKYIEPDLTQYVWLVVYADYQQTGNYEEISRKPYDESTIDSNITTKAAYPPEWDKLAD